MKNVIRHYFCICKLSIDDKMKIIFVPYITFLSLFISFFSFAQTEKVREKEMNAVVIKTQKRKKLSKKENPAFHIIRKVWEKKRNNDLDKFNTYTFKEYEKIQFNANNLDSTFIRRKIFNKLNFIFDYADSTANRKVSLPIFLNEAVYQNYGQNKPDKKKKRLMIAQKSSGFENNEIVSLAAKNLYRDINIYDNTLNLFDIGFTSPVARDGFSTYDYQLIDTLYVNGQESFKIKYQPKRKDILAFQGSLYISTDHYAVVKAILKSTKKMNVNFVNRISAHLEYDNIDDDTFLPKKMRISIDLSPFSKNKKTKSMTANRTVDYSDYQFDIPIDEAQFERRESEMDKSFYEKDDAFWATARTDSLNQQEQGIYEMLDRLESVPKFNKMVKMVEVLSSGYYNVGYIDIGNLSSIYGYNEVEGNRISLGARTFFSRNDDWRIQGYGAYGFKDKKFKYGVEGKYMFNKINRFTVGVGVKEDIDQLGVQLTDEDGIMTRSFASSSILGRGENTSLSKVKQANIFTSVEPWKNFQVRVDGSLQSIKSADENIFNLYYSKNETLRKTVNDAHVTFSLIARPGAKYSTNGVERHEHSTLAPTIVLKYTRGFEGLFNADFGYNKLQLYLYKPFLIGNWGKMLVNFEAGKNFNTVPLALQNIIPANQSYGLIYNTFSQLNYYEFVADTYTTLHVEHHFNGKILSYIPLIKKLKLREVAFLRTAYGTLSDESKSINQEGFKYMAPSEKIYYEYGFGIENIGFGNLRIFRVDFNWRGNYLNNPDVSKFGIKAGFKFGF